jgi:hypothetical protein
MSKRKQEEDTIQVVAARPAESFDSWWTRFQARYGVTKDLKESVMLHAKARGLWETSDWRRVAEDFGYDVRDLA